MNTKTTPEEAKALAVKYAFFLIEPENVRLAALIDEARATEREACAKVCEEMAEDELGNTGSQCYECAEAIRSMGQASEQAGAVQVPQGWQAIESAPKDGRTLLLGYYNSCNKWRTLRGSWMSAGYIAETFEEPDNADEGWYETSVEADDIPNCWGTTPTHWMPLPAAPQPGEQK